MAIGVAWSDGRGARSRIVQHGLGAVALAARAQDVRKAQQQLDKLLAERESLAKQLREMAGGGGGDASPVQEQEPAPPGPDASPDDLRRYRWDQLNRTLEKALQEQANAVK